MIGLAPAPAPVALAAERREPLRGAWGLLGGTFDPPHYAHLAIAEHVRAVLDLAGVLFIPAREPPHKVGRPISPVDDRVAMVVAAIADNAAFRLSRIEVDRPGPSYTVDTLALLAADPPGGDPTEAPRGEFVLILSSEALLGLPGWHEPQRILERCRIAVVPRLGYRAPAPAWLSEHFPGQEGRVRFIDGPELGHSASLIRRYVTDGRPIRYLVPPAVEAYIADHDLYRTPPWTAA